MDEEAERKIVESDIFVGNIIWWFGKTITSSWSCPAEIVKVDPVKRTFFIKSLDDMQETHQEYPFDIDDRSTAFRLSMMTAAPWRVLLTLNSYVEDTVRQVARLEKELAKAKERRDAVKLYFDNYCALNSS
jgi:hypothetical protein